jgi:hypothetical protein
MAKPNYQFEKRQRDLAKQRKQEDKRQQKLANKAADREAQPTDLQRQIPLQPGQCPESDVVSP